MRLLITYLLIAFISSCGGDSGGGDPAATEDEEEEEEHEQKYKDRTYELVNIIETTNGTATTYTPTSSNLRVEMTFDEYEDSGDGYETYTMEVTGVATFSSSPYGSSLMSIGCSTGSKEYSVRWDLAGDVRPYGTLGDADDSCNLGGLTFAGNLDISISSSALTNTDEATSTTTYEYEFEKL